MCIPLVLGMGLITPFLCLITNNMLVDPLLHLKSGAQVMLRKNFGLVNILLTF
jgi:hypothetical protein